MTREPVVLSWSGGKDSSLALEAIRRDGRFDIVGLLTSVTSGYDRISIHGVRRELLHRQAHAVGLPLFELTLEPITTNDAYEAAFLAALDRLRASHPSLRRIAFGDLFLEEVRAYRERLLDTARISGLFPLWGRDTAGLARHFVAQGYRAHLVCVDTTQLSPGFAGASFDDALLAALPPEVDPCGERGEFHTFVSDGPIFERPVPVRVGEVVRRGLGDRFAYCDLLADE